MHETVFFVAVGAQYRGFGNFVADMKGTVLIKAFLINRDTARWINSSFAAFEGWLMEHSIDSASRWLVEAFTFAFSKCCWVFERKTRIDMMLTPPCPLNKFKVCCQTTFRSILWMCFCCQGPPPKKKTSWFQFNYLIKERMNKTWVTENEWVKELSFSVVCNPCESNFFLFSCPSQPTFLSPAQFETQKFDPPSST